MASTRGNPYQTPIYNSMVADPLTAPLESLNSSGFSYLPAGPAWPYPVPAQPPMSALPMPMPVQAPVPVQGAPAYPTSGQFGVQGTEGLARLLTDTLGGGSSGANCVAVLIFGDESMVQQLQQHLPGVQNGFGAVPAQNGYAAIPAHNGYGAIPAQNGYAAIPAYGAPGPAYGAIPAYGPGPVNGYPAQPVPHPQLLAYQDTGSHPAVPGATVAVPALPPASGWQTERESDGDRRGLMGRFGAAMRELRGR